MRRIGLLTIVFLLASAAFAQGPAPGRPAATPTPAPVLTPLQKCYQSQQRQIWLDVIENCTAAINAEPAKPDGYARRALGYSKLSKFAESNADIDKALTMLPNHADLLTLRGSNNRELGKYAPALADLNAALQQKPDSANALWVRTLVYYETGKYDLGIADAEKVLRLQPKAENAKRLLEKLKAGPDWADKALEGTWLGGTGSNFIIIKKVNGKLECSFEYFDYTNVAASDTYKCWGMTVTRAPRKTDKISFKYTTLKKAEFAFEGEIEEPLSASGGWSIKRQKTPGQDLEPASYSRYSGADLNRHTNAMAEAFMRERAKMDDATQLRVIGMQIKINPESGDLYYGRAMVYARMRNYPAAEADLSKAIGLSEKQTLGFITAENYAARGDVNVLQNKRDLAISDYKKALEYDVTNKRAKAGLQKLGLQP